MGDRAWFQLVRAFKWQQEVRSSFTRTTTLTVASISSKSKKTIVFWNVYVGWDGGGIGLMLIRYAVGRKWNEMPPFRTIHLFSFISTTVYASSKQTTTSAPSMLILSFQFIFHHIFLFFMLVVFLSLLENRERLSGMKWWFQPPRFYPGSLLMETWLMRKIQSWNKKLKPK